MSSSDLRSSTDLVHLIKALNVAANDFPELRPMLLRASHSLEQVSSFMTAAIQQLKEASIKRAGVMDNIGAHDELARLKNQTMERVADDLMFILRQTTPAYAETMRAQRTTHAKLVIDVEAAKPEEVI